MRRGIVGIEFAPDAAVAAPISGVQLGVGQAGAIALRLFRVSGTRLVLASRVLPAQLIAIRTATAGTPVQVVTSRPQLWEPLLQRDAGLHVVSPSEVRQPAGGPTLLIDDRPAEARGPGETRPWQCRLDIRSQWTPAELGSFAHSDVAVFGAIPAEVTGMVAATFGLPARATEPLGRLDAGSFGILRRGRIEYVSLNPTPAEGRVLELARGIGPVAPVLQR
jgi:hypothetical protein